MVRETRYLWVGNLPEKIVEERIVEYFARFVDFCCVFQIFPTLLFVITKPIGIKLWCRHESWGSPCILYV